MTFRIYTDPEVKRLMGMLTDGLRMSNTIAAAGLTQSTQTLDGSAPDRQRQQPEAVSISVGSASGCATGAK